MGYLDGKEGQLFPEPDSFAQGSPRVETYPVKGPGAAARPLPSD